MKKAEQFVERHALIKPNTTVLVGVSGGPDSIALLHFLAVRRKLWQIKVIALTINHQLRADAANDVAYVKRMCEALKIKCVATKIDVDTYQQQHRLSTQVAARTLRYRFFREQMEVFKANYLALGHHGDDQLETMLMSMARSTSTKALSGIPWQRPFVQGVIIRPFLTLSKTDINNYCEKHQLEPVFDPSNEDPSYTRNYFRQTIVPLMQEQNRNLSTTLQRLSESLQYDEQYLAKQAQIVWENIIKKVKQNERITFKRQDFLRQPKALQRRIYHLILNYLYTKLPSVLTYTHEDNFYALLMSESSHVRINFPQQLLIEKSYDQIYVYFKSSIPEKIFEQKQLNVPGKVVLPDGSILKAELTTGIHPTNSHSHIFQGTKQDLPLYVRTRQPGDRMTWAGLQGRKKVKDIFIDEKIPHEQRDPWPLVVTSHNEVVWLVGLKKGQLLKKASKEQLNIHLTYIENRL